MLGQRQATAGTDPVRIVQLLELDCCTAFKMHACNSLAKMTLCCLWNVIHAHL